MQSFLVKDLKQLSISPIEQDLYIWIDANKDSNDNINSFKVLSKSFWILCTKTVEEAVKIITQQNGKSIKIISSAALSSQVKAEIDKFNNITTVFIFCSKKAAGESIKEGWKKVKDFSLNVKDLIKKMETNAREQKAMKFFPLIRPIKSIDKFRYVLQGLTTIKDLVNAKTHFQCVAEKLCQSQSQTHIKAFKNNSIEFEAFEGMNINIAWYMKECFYYKVLDKFLKSGSDSTQMAYVRYPFFNLFEAISSRYVKDRKQKLIVYKGAHLTAGQIEFYRSGKGDIIEILGFLLAKENLENDDEFENAVFKIEVDNQNLHDDFNYGYVDVTKYHRSDQQQILFNAFNTFRIAKIESVIEGLTQIVLEYGAIPSLIYKSKNKIRISEEEKDILANFQKEQLDLNSITNQQDAIQKCSQVGMMSIEKKKPIKIKPKHSDNLKIARMSLLHNDFETTLINLEKVTSSEFIEGDQIRAMSVNIQQMELQNGKMPENKELEQIKLLVKKLSQRVQQTQQKNQMLTHEVRLMKKQIDQLSERVSAVHRGYTEYILPRLEVKRMFEKYESENKQVYEYAKKFYWTLSNYLFCYRAISTGMIKGEPMNQTKFQGLFNCVLKSIPSSIVSHIPVIGAALAIVQNVTFTLIEKFYEKKFELEVEKIMNVIMQYQSEDELSLEIGQAAISVVEARKSFIENYGGRKLNWLQRKAKGVEEWLNECVANQTGLEIDHQKQIFILAIVDVIFVVNVILEEKTQKNAINNATKIAFDSSTNFRVKLEKLYNQKGLKHLHQKNS